MPHALNTVATCARTTKWYRLGLGLRKAPLNWVVLGWQAPQQW